MLLLCLDSSSAASVALLQIDNDPGLPSGDHDASPENARVLAEWSTEDTRSHAEVLTPAVQEVLERVGTAPEDLSGILVGTGPGPFTGLRAGLVTARVLGYAWDLPVWGMTSLAALAYDVAALPQPPSSFIVAADARRREVYWAQYRLQGTGAPLLVDGPRVGPAQELPDLPVYGRGAGLYAAQLPQAVVEPVPGGPQQEPSGWQASAASLGLAAAEALAAGQQLSQDLSPLYLRDSDAKVPGPRKKAGA